MTKRIGTLSAIAVALALSSRITSYNVCYTKLLREYNISDRWGSFVSNIQGSGMSDVIGNLNINPGQGTSTKTIDLGMYGGNINVDFSLFDWSKLGYILIVITGFVCTRIVVLKH